MKKEEEESRKKKKEEEEVDLKDRIKALEDKLKEKVCSEII